MPPQPNVGSGLLHIHACITRALDVSIARGQEFARQGFPNPSLRAGYLDYCRALVSIVHGHHLSEEEIAFPYLAGVLPGAPYADLLADHRSITVLLEQLKPQVEAVASAADTAAALKQLAATLEQLRGIWRLHIPKEESNFSVERLAELIPAPEHLRLLREIGEHSQTHTGPDYLTVPFLLFNLQPDARAAMSAGMPPIVTQQLVPIVWKEKWAPMQPFLLP